MSPRYAPFQSNIIVQLFIRDINKSFPIFLEKILFFFFFKNNNGLLFQDFLELSERLRVLEENEKDRAKSSLVQSTETKQGVNNKVRL